MEYYLAIDIGASSGRHILGSLDDGKLVLKEIYRFDNAVGNLDSHRLLAGYGRFDTYTCGGKVQRYIIDKVEYRAYLDALLGRKLVTSDCRSAGYVDYACAHLK